MKTKPTLIQAGFIALAISGILTLGMGDGLAVDWGDAPDSYKTLSSSGGPSHTTGGGLFLGASVDDEGNGQPDLPARGDDTDLLGPSGGDDEDGVFLTSPLVPGSLASVTVIASLGTGKLDAWMDFDGSGMFDDPAEKIFASVPLAAGSNFLTFPVPVGAIVDPRIYSRWRLSEAGSLSPTGSTSTGEVEDYCHSPIHGQKWHDLNGNGKRDDNEPGLNGQVIELYDELGTTLIATATTHDFEHTGTATIDPFYERGLYWMHAPAGFCILREKPNPSLIQTFPANCGAKEYFIWVQCEPLGREPKPPVFGNVPNWLELFTTPGSDDMFSAAQIIIEQPTGPNLTMFANGPTFVNRTAAMNTGTNNAFIQTEMVAMDLVGHHPAIGRFHARAGTQVLPPLSPASQGQILENGGDQFIVDSFFDVFFEIEIPEFSLQMRNDWNIPGSAQVETKITQIPPFGAEYVEEDIPLFPPTPFPGPTGPPNGFKIIKLVHKPIHGLDFGNATVPPTVLADDPTKATLERKIKKLKKKIKNARKRKLTAKTKRLTKQLRRLKKRLRAL